MGDVCFGSVLGSVSQRAKEASGPVHNRPRTWAQWHMHSSGHRRRLPATYLKHWASSEHRPPPSLPPQCRMAMFLAGFPVSVPVHTVNRQCCSGGRCAGSHCNRALLLTSILQSQLMFAPQLKHLPPLPVNVCRPAGGGTGGSHHPGRPHHRWHCRRGGEHEHQPHGVLAKLRAVLCPSLQLRQPTCGMQT